MTPLTTVQKAVPQSPAGQRPTVLIEEDVCIPAWVTDLETFRQWTYSDEFPERGRICCFNGVIWVDLSMEQLFSHNQVKTVFTAVLWQLVESLNLGYLFSDGTRWSHVGADFSTEPDALVVAYDTMKSGRIKMVEGKQEGDIELEGMPDMVLEIVSDTSVDKDTKRLRKLYWNAGVPEYWGVDPRGDSLRFDLLRHTARGYTAARASKGWLQSKIFDRKFKLVRETDPLGNPRCKLLVQ